MSLLTYREKVDTIIIENDYQLIGIINDLKIAGEGDNA